MDNLVGSFRVTYRHETTDFIPDGLPSTVSTIIGALNERENCDHFYVETYDSFNHFAWLIYLGDEPTGFFITVPEEFG